MDKIKEVYAKSIHYFHNSPYNVLWDSEVVVESVQPRKSHDGKVISMYQIKFYWDLDVTLYFRKVGHDSYIGVLLYENEDMEWTLLNVDTNNGQDGVIGIIMGVEEYLVGRYNLQ